jgi:hypothetical protein
VSKVSDMINLGSESALDAPWQQVETIFS